MFGTIESTIYPIIEGITESMLFSNLKAEVALVFGDQVNENGAKLFELWLEKKLPHQNGLLFAVVVTWDGVRMALDERSTATLDMLCLLLT